jgi:hypothetical protein
MQTRSQRWNKLTVKEKEEREKKYQNDKQKEPVRCPAKKEEIVLIKTNLFKLSATNE